jgi:hypothetical protein
MPVVWTICAIIDVVYIGGKIAVALLFLGAIHSGWGH